MFRKLALRRELLGLASDGAVYLPFCGDGDIAAEIYADRPLFAIDLDADRIATISGRKLHPESRFLAATADTWPGRDAEAFTYAVADFDAYSEPYPAFREFWQHASKTDRLILFFTDGHRQGINSYWSKVIEPWFAKFVKPWRVVRTFKYLRGMMLYWGAVIESPALARRGKKAEPKMDPDDVALGAPDESDAGTFTDEELGLNPLRVGKFGPLKKRRFLELLRQGSSKSEAASLCGVTLRTVEKHQKAHVGFREAVDLVEMDLNTQVENALLQAAKSGNVVAIQVWLYNRASDRWKDKRNLGVDHRVDVAGEIEKIAAAAGIPVEQVRTEFERLLRPQ